MGVVVKDVAVHFGSGQEVLSSYWGYLSDGGLIVDDSGGLAVGEEIALRVTIESSRSQYLFRGRVVRHELDDGRAVIAFLPGEPHDMLLTDALSETDDVPARRMRRFRVDLEAEVRTGEDLARVRIVNVSEGGCCLELPPDVPSGLQVGSSVAIRCESFAAQGTIVWSRNRERGVRFADASSIEAIDAIGALLRSR